MFNDTKLISVLNYNETCVCVSIAPGKSIMFEASNYGEPTVIPLPMNEIMFINNGYAFKTGLLEFPKEVEDEIYQSLRIDKSKVLKLKEIREILLSPTKEGLIKIVSIDSSANFDRVRSQFQKLKNEGHKLTLDVADIVNRRSKELLRGKSKSDIQIGDPDVPVENKRVSELEKQLEEMKAMMAQMMTMQESGKSATTEESNVSNSDNTNVVEEKKKPGRPKKG